MVRIAPNLRRKIYLILVFVSLTLLFYSSWQVRPVIVEPYDPVGLVSHLALGYWIGLALLVIVSAFAFLDRELKKDAIFISILLALGLFLMVITLFVYENAVDPEIYYPFGEVRNLLAADHLDIANPPALICYWSWPTLHFISASILEITGLELTEVGHGLVKYGPLFFMLCFVFITYSIGKRFGLTPNHCFLLSCLSLSSWLFIFEYTSRALGIILFLLLFMLLLTPKRTAAHTLAVILIFSALVLTHGLTALAVIPGLLLLFIYRKEPRFVALFIAIFGAWYMYQVPLAIEGGVNVWLKPMQDIFHYAETETYYLPASPARAVSRYSVLSYVALYGVLTIGSIILLLWRRITGERRKQVISLFCWSIPIGLLIFGGYEQIMIRGYVFLIVPAVCITVLSFSRWRLLMVALMVLCVAAYLPANYAGQVSGEQILTTEVKGTEFFALKVRPNRVYYYGYSPAMIIYYDPALIKLPMQTLAGATPGEIDFSVMDDLRYIVMSKQGTNFKLYAWGKDPTAAWPQNKVGKRADLIYNNGYFQIYLNNLAE